ncbi:hypothetical protein [Leptolyngbya sp. Cla-17]|nr:hypothetical protein [Leptolyngbya sp. Cla-17]
MKSAALFDVVVEQFAWSGLPKDFGILRKLFAAAQTHHYAA